MQKERRQPDGISAFSTAAVLLIPLVWTFEASAIGPDLGRIAQAFPHASQLQVELVMTMPFVTAVIFSALSGRLARRIERKAILIFGLLLYGITGILPTFANSINEILLLRLLTGIGVGLVSPVPNAIITERFAGEPQRRLLGMTSSIANIANVIASLVSGLLLVYGWQYPFYSFAVLFIIAAISFVGIPTSLPRTEQEDRKKEALSTLPRSVYGLFLLMTLNWVFLTFITTSIAIFMISEKIGQPWMIGIVISFPALACIVFGPFYPEFAKTLRRFFIPAAFLAYAVGFLIVGTSHAVVGLCLGAFLVGIGNGTLTPHILVLTSGRIRASQRDVAFGVVTAGIGGGNVLSPFVQALITLISIGSPHRFLYLFAAGAALIVCAISVPLVKSVKHLGGHRPVDSAAGDFG